MNNHDMRTFGSILADVYALLRQDCSDGVRRLWWQALKPYPIEAVQQAFAQHICNPDVGQYLPKPADIIRVLTGSSEERALRAWSDVDCAVRTRGPYVSVVFDDPLTHAVIAAMGGWVTLCRKSVDEWPFVQKDFVTRYKGYVNHPPASYPRCLIGLTDADHQRRGLPSPRPPTLIGSPERARQVYTQGEGPMLAIRHNPTPVFGPALMATKDERAHAC